MSDGQPSAVDAVAYALVHATAGVVVGTALQAAMHPLSDAEALPDTVAMAAVRAVANGIAVFAASRLLDGRNDPTACILFTWALMITQTTLTERLRRLGGELAAHLASVVPVLSTGAEPAVSCSKELHVSTGGAPGSRGTRRRNGAAAASWRAPW
jgi:hypothetical protein